MERVIEAFGTHDLLSSDKDQLLVRRHAQNFIRSEQLALAQRIRPAESWRVVADAYGAHIAGGALDLHRSDADTVTDVFRRQNIGTSEEDRRVTCSEDLLPLIIGISVFHLANVLEEDRDAATPGSDRTALLREVGDQTAVWEFVKDELDLRIQHPVFAVVVCVADKTDEQKREEEAAEKIERAVLVGHDAEIRALSLSRQFQIDLMIGRDVPDLLGLHDLQLAPEPDDHTRPHRLRGLLENRERCRRRRRREDFAGE